MAILTFSASQWHLVAPILVKYGLELNAHTGISLAQFLQNFQGLQLVPYLLNHLRHKISQMWNNGLKLHTLHNARYSGPRHSDCWEQCTFATYWKSRNCQNFQILSTISSPFHQNLTKFSWMLPMYRYVCTYPSGKGPAYSGPLRWGLFIADPLR